MTLEQYSRKRDFERTPEPPPRVKKEAGPLTFVIHKHKARQLHYDLRLELDGVLKSWAVPKGPSLDPAVKHMAVMVEDHPLDYASFEGGIPKGEYGAGEVVIWDNGTYSPDEGGGLLFDDRSAAEEQMRDGLSKGKLSFTLHGRKLKGSWTLIKLKKTEKDWLLMKHRDEYAGADKDILKEDKSVVSGRTVEDIKAGREATTPDPSAPDLKQIPGAVPAPFLGSVPPMLTSLGDKPFSNPDWIFEPKLDGYRTMARIRKGDVTLLSRNSNVVTDKYSLLVPELSRQPVSEIILDGEIIALDEKGKQCFQCLQNYMRSMRGAKDKESKPFTLFYYVFDILYLDGYDLQAASLRSRKTVLHSVFVPGEHVKLVDHFEKEGETVYQAAVSNGLEGVIAKRFESKYEPGKRSDSWVKIKATQSDEFVIGGYSQTGRGRSQTFSSLLLGYYDKGKLIFAGHVGTGFDEELLVSLKKQLDALKTDTIPFTEDPALNAPTTWVRPELVAEVKFSEWTQDGRLRAPVFLRLREDKPPKEVRRNTAVTIPASDRREKATKAPKSVSEPDPPADPDTPVTGILKRLNNAKDTITIEIEGSQVKFSHLDKVLWPAEGKHPAFSKRDFLVYLVKVSSYILPHLKDRPLSLNRFPEGIHGEHWFQKHWVSPTPDFVQKVSITEKKGASEYLLCNNLPSLIWLGQQANLEFHTWYSRTVAGDDLPKSKGTDYFLDYPDFIIFDLDPYIYSGKESKGDEPELNRKGFDKTCEAALWLKETLGGLGLEAYIKTSGKTGLHVYVPIKRALDYTTVRKSAEIVGKYLVQKHPDEVTTEWAQEKRKGKIFVDYNQNVRGKTLASLYSPRPAPGAPVSTPLKWSELGKVYPTDFTMATVPDRLKKTGDLWADILEKKQDLGKLV